MIYAHVEVARNTRIVMDGIINLDPYINCGSDKTTGLKCITCGFIGNDLRAHYCGKCGQPLQFINRLQKWNEDGGYYELKPSSLFNYREPEPLEWEVVGTGILREAKLFEKLKDVILKEEKEGNSIFRTKKQFLKELLSIIS